MKKINFISPVAVVMVVLSGGSLVFGFAGGDGSESTPWQISTKADLESVNNNLSAHYILVNDIDLTSANPYTNSIIASVNSSGFNGSFDGDGYVIFGPIINGGSNYYIGLFGYLGSGGEVKNLGVENCDISGNEYVGGLVGCNLRGSITNCYSKGVVTATGHSVGGLVGTNTGNIGGVIADSYSTCTVTGIETCVSVGGLVGHNYYGASIVNCYSTGTVTGAGYDVGGLVGRNHFISSITNSYSTGTVTGTSHSVGGLVGSNDRNISNCYSTGTVTGNDYVGGLVGFNDTDGSNITHCFSEGTVTGEDFVGGLTGTNQGSISNSYSLGMVTGNGEVGRVGGLTGDNYGSASISNSYSTGGVSGNDAVGGLCGEQFGSGTNISNSFWDIETSGTSVGYNLDYYYPGSITNVVGKTTVEMRTEITFTSASWDFSTSWKMLRENEDYPRLIWQEEFVGDIAGLYGVDIIDFAYLAGYWGLDDCYGVDDCGRADIDEGGSVGLEDLAVFISQWLKGKQ